MKDDSKFLSYYGQTTKMSQQKKRRDTPNHHCCSIHSHTKIQHTKHENKKYF